MKLEFIPFNIKLKKQLYEMFKDFPQEEFDDYYSETNMKYGEFKKYFKKILKNAEIRKYYTLLCNNIPVGIGIIRTEGDNAYSELVGNHISYRIRNSYRGKGFGNYLLNQIVKESFNLGCSCLIAQVKKNNEISKKVLKANSFKQYNLKENGKLKADEKDIEVFYLNLK